MPIGAPDFIGDGTGLDKGREIAGIILQVLEYLMAGAKALLGNG
jgi:hypothetical protein